METVENNSKRPVKYEYASRIVEVRAKTLSGDGRRPSEFEI